MNGLLTLAALLLAFGPVAPPQQPVQPPPQTAPQAAPAKQKRQGPRRGLTFAKASQNDTFKTVLVTCHGQPKPEGAQACNPSDGDTLCTERRPVLCLKPDGSPRPPYTVTSSEHSMPKEYYEGWAEGRLGVTPPVAGTSLTSLAAANALCEQALGKGYRMAEFHDGKYFEGMDAQNANGPSWPRDRLSAGGWAFHAFGAVPADTRFWVSINDQRGHCWDR
jgi:hypothetical protein